MLNVSSAFLSAIKQGSRTVDGSIGIGDKALTNLVTDSNFSNGTSLWNAVSSTVSASNNILTCTGDGTQTNPNTYQNVIATIGHIYYFTTSVRVLDSGCINIRSRFSSTVDAVSVANPTVGKWYKISGTNTATNITTPFYFIHDYTTATDANGKRLEVSPVILLDLTDLYGAGNEPTQAYMDALFAKVGWFDGTKNVPNTFLDTSSLDTFDIDSALGNGNLPSIGATIASKLTLTVINDGTLPQTIVGQAIRPYVAVDVTGTGSYEWVKLGEFYADYDGVDIGKLETTIEAFDKMAEYMDTAYTTSLTFPNTVQNVLDEISSTYGTRFNLTSLASRNLCSSDFNSWEDGHYVQLDGTKGAYAGGVRMRNLIPVQPNTTYYVNAFDTEPTYSIQFVIRSYDASGVFTTSVGGLSNGVTFTTGANDYFIGVSLYSLTGGNPTHDEYASFFASGSVKPYICLDSDIKTFQENLKLTTLKELPTGSLRQVISQVASLLSANATIDNDGCVKFIFLNSIPDTTFSMGLDNYSDFKLQPDKTISITELIHSNGNLEMPWGTTNGYALSFQNDQVKSLQDVQAIYNRIFPINYYAYTMKAQGMPHLELGDVISFTYVMLDGTEKTITIPILKHKFTFKGAFVSEFSASAPQQQKTSVAVTSGSTLADAVDVTYGNLQQSIEMASKQITGNQGGFITTILNDANQPQELVISNTPDYNTADMVWRWNAGGLGFSSEGFNGTMDLALTADGQINASKVTTGILDAGIIKAGIIKDAKNQSWLNMVDGTFNFGNGKLVWDGSDFSINFVGTSIESALDGKVDEDAFAPYESNIQFTNGIITLGKADNPFSVNITNQAVEFIDKGTTGGTLNLTAISGDGTSVTCTYASQAVIPYQVGGYVQISGCSVSAYNGTWLITSCTKTQVVLSCKATETVSTGFGTIQYGSSPNTVAYINGQKMFISDLQTTSSMQVGNHIITQYDSNITLIKYAG